MRRRACFFAFLYIFVIAYLSLFPWTFLDHQKSTGLTLRPWVGRREVLDGVLNFFFYLPLGFSLMLAMGRRKVGFLVATLAGIGLSWSIETAQLWTEYRVAAYSDWAMNSVGTLLGAALAGILGGRWLTHPEVLRTIQAWRLKPTAALFCGLWLLWQCFPFIPRIAIPVTVAQLTNPAPWSWQEFVATALGFASLRVLVGPSPWIWIALAGVFSSPVLVDRTLSIGGLAGAAVGWAGAASSRRSLGVLAAALPLWLIFEEFRPFQLVGPGTEISWVPFASWFDRSGTSYYPLIFQKLFFYTASPWLLRAIGWRPAVALGLPLGILVLGEWAQRYLQGRTPELTDPVLMLAGWILVLLIRDSPSNLADAS